MPKLTEEEKKLAKYGFLQGLDEKAVVEAIVEERIKATRKFCKDMEESKRKLDEQYTPPR